MDLNRLIPDKFRPIINPQWVVKGKFLMFKKYEHIPVCFIEDDVVYVFLDDKIHNKIFQITKHLIELGVEFYFTTPILSNPKLVEDLDRKIILSYLNAYSNRFFFNGFNEIGFDLIYNMVKWTEKANCFDLVKEVYEEVKKRVDKKEEDYYSGKSEYTHPQEIREAFNGLYRDIQINKIL